MNVVQIDVKRGEEGRKPLKMRHSSLYCVPRVGDSRGELMRCISYSVDGPETVQVTESCSHSSPSLLIAGGPPLLIAGGILAVRPPLLIAGGRSSLLAVRPPLLIAGGRSRLLAVRPSLLIAGGRWSSAPPLLIAGERASAPPLLIAGERASVGHSLLSRGPNSSADSSSGSQLIFRPLAAVSPSLLIAEGRAIAIGLLSVESSLQSQLFISLVFPYYGRLICLVYSRIYRQK